MNKGTVVHNPNNRVPYNVVLYRKTFHNIDTGYGAGIKLYGSYGSFGTDNENGTVRYYSMVLDQYERYGTDTGTVKEYYTSRLYCIVVKRTKVMYLNFLIFSSIFSSEHVINETRVMYLNFFLYCQNYRDQGTVKRLLQIKSTDSAFVITLKVTFVSMYKEARVYTMERRPGTGSLDDVTDPPNSLVRNSSLTNLSLGPAPEKKQVKASYGYTVTGTSTVPTGTVPIASTSAPTAMEEDCAVRADLGAAHHQSMTTRKKERRVSATSLVTDSTFFNTASADPDRVGSMNPPGDTDVLKTFRGVRLHRGGRL